MKNLFKILFLSIILTSFIKADDLLASLTNGKISDNSNGVKVLNLEEMEQIKGGYITYLKPLSNNEVIAFAVPDWYNELGIYTNNKGEEYFFNKQGLMQFGGMCGLEITNCATNQQHSYESRQRLLETMSIVGDDPYQNYLGYTVKRNVAVSNLGQRYVYFSYGVAVINANLGSWYRVSSSNVLNNYKVIREISLNYKNKLENYLGGYSIR